MKKKLILITYDLLNAMHYRQELLDFFGGLFELETHTITDGIGEHLKADAVLALSPINNEEILKHFDDEPIIIHGVKAISNTGYKKLMNIVPGTKVLLMTTNRTSAFDMAAYLYQLGINHIDFVPSYPDNPETYSVDIAVTPGQVRFIPSYITKVIDIGWRLISADTLMSVMVALEIKTNSLLEKLYQTSKEILNSDFSHAPLDLYSNTKDLLTLTINLIDDGLLFLNTSDHPAFVNQAFLSMMNLNEQTIDTRELIRYLPMEVRELILDPSERDNYIFKLEKQEKIYTFSKHIFSLYKDTKGFLIILKDAKKIESLEHEIRKKSIHKNAAAKYQFSDIICKSSVMKDCIQRAKRMALTDFPILINGESGTGKELFAQSVHQYSARSAHPFIALNCASLSNELLESELFGYEEGAFTGAKRGGKKGLFELAQNGTIFLDEIGEMPVILQAKLLRVLQEQEIRKLGSSTTIPINVRIITATNRNLPDMIEQGLFRLDLYYRISMFTLVIPPLRERIDDILPLSEHFLKSFKIHHSITPALQELLLSYSWKGNIRELQNCIEYMAYMGSGALTPNDLPPGYNKKMITTSQTDLIHSQKDSPISNSSVEFSDLFSREGTLCQRILSLLYQQPMGRMKILKELNYDYTEHEIKKAFEYLHEKNWIKSSRGRGGTSLTSAGVQQFRLASQSADTF